MGDKAATDLIEELNHELQEHDEEGADLSQQEHEIFEEDGQGKLIAVKRKVKRDISSLKLQEFLLVEELLTAKKRNEYPTLMDTKSVDGRSNPKEIAVALDISTIKKTLPDLRLGEKRYLLIAALVEKMAREIASIPTGDPLLQLDFKVIRSPCFLF